jgi:hypothetical protein
LDSPRRARELLSAAFPILHSAPNGMAVAPPTTGGPYMLAYWVFVAITIGVSFAWVKIRRTRKGPNAAPQTR